MYSMVYIFMYIMFNKNIVELSQGEGNLVNHIKYPVQQKEVI